MNKIVVVFREDKQSYKAGDVFGIFNSLNEVLIPSDLQFSVQFINIEDDFELYNKTLHENYWINKSDSSIVVEDPQDASAYRKGAGLFVSLTLDSVKVSERDELILNSSREHKLARLRSLRIDLLREVDVMINDLTVGESNLTIEQIKNYRSELKDVTEPYKDYNSNSTHALALDSLDVDSFVWPTKP